MDFQDLDLEDSRLEATFPAPGEIRHISYHSDPDIGKRMIEDEEIWHTKRNLGEGGFGTVWLQKRVSHNGPKKPSFRAVKVLDKSGKSANMYKKELMAMAKFSKPLYRRCFIECYGWYLQADNVCITMEYARHQDLQKHLTKPFPESEVGLIASQLAEGLRFMHDNRYAHRDLKPANIMVMYPGPDWWVKIGDFGISKRAIEGVTSLHTKVFTPDYAAPELRGLGVSRAVANGPKDEIRYTFAIDMWSFGEICVRLLTKTAAFPELMQLVNYKLYGIFLPDDVLYQNGLGSDCRSFIRKAMDMNPENRFTAEEAQGHPWITKFKNAPFSQDTKISTYPSSEIAPLDNTAEENTAFAQSQSQGTAEWDTVEQLETTAINRDKLETSRTSDTHNPVSVPRDKLTDDEEDSPVLENLALWAAITEGSSSPVKANQERWATILEPSSSSVNITNGSKSREVKDHNTSMPNSKTSHNTDNGKLASSLSQNVVPGDYLFVLYDFAARSDDELTIKRAQIVKLIETDHIYKDEWWLGEEVRTKKRGIFPARYTRKATLHEEQLNGIHINTYLQLDASAYRLAPNAGSEVNTRLPSAHPKLSSAHLPLHKVPDSAADGRHDKTESENRNSQSRARKVFDFFR